MIDLAAIVPYAISIITGVGAWFAGRKKEKAKAAAEVAASGADRAISDAESSLYNRLRERLDSLESDITNLRRDLDAERKHSRALELHVWTLERLMRQANMEPPVFSEAGILKYPVT